MKRNSFGFALILICLCACCTALAQTVLQKTPDGVGWLSFALEDAQQTYGAEGLPLNTAPNGLEAMYRWMNQGSEGSELVRVRMPAGRVLISAGMTEIGKAISVEELGQMWPTIARRLGKTTLYVNDEKNCASTISIDGREWLSIQTTAVLEGDKMLSVSLQGFANCDTGFLVELWMVEPAQPTYLYDDEAAAELAADKEAANRWMEGLRVPLLDDGAELPAFSEPSASGQENETVGIAPSAVTVEYADSDGWFTMRVPENVVVINAGNVEEKTASAQEDVTSQARLPLYRHWLGEVEEYDATLFTEPNYGVAVLLMTFTSDPPMTLEDLEAMEESITATVARDMKGTIQVGDRARGEFEGEEYASYVYEGSYSGRPVVLIILASSKGTSVREINIWRQDAPMNDEWIDALLNALDTFHYIGAAE